MLHNSNSRNPASRTTWSLLHTVYSPTCIEVLDLDIRPGITLSFMTPCDFIFFKNFSKFTYLKIFLVQEIIWYFLPHLFLVYHYKKISELNYMPESSRVFHWSFYVSCTRAIQYFNLANKIPDCLLKVSMGAACLVSQVKRKLFVT